MHTEVRGESQVSFHPIEREAARKTLGTDIPDPVALGESVAVRISVTNGNGALVEAVVPLELDIIDPEGVEMERSGYYGAANSELSVTLDIARNDPEGLWELRATEGATGTVSRAYLRVHASR